VNDETALPGRSAITSPGDNGSTRGGRGICVICHVREATKRRTPSYIATWNLPEPVCGDCADELDELAERCSRGALQVDRAVRSFRGKAARRAA
jgi:hypothetical protein